MRRPGPRLVRAAALALLAAAAAWTLAWHATTGAPGAEVEASLLFPCPFHAWR